MQPIHDFTEERYESLRVWYDYIDSSWRNVRQLSMDWIPERSRYMALFFLFYRHPYVEYSIRNVMYHLGPAWGLQVVTNQVSYEFAKSITSGWPGVHITPVELNAPDDTYEKTDILKRSADFWRIIKGEILFLFDFDTILRKGFSLEEFASYDYVAPLWHRDELWDSDWPVGCGQLSLRRKATMLEICESHDPDFEQYPREDVFYVANLAERDPSRVAPPSVAQRFASQNDLGDDPFALRRAWIGNPPDNLARLLASIRY